METTHLLVYGIGFVAQLFFSARTLVQWILSERQKQVVSPSLFWILSLAGSYLLCLYGWLRDDFSIVLGQFLSYYIYLWNLDVKGIWRKIPRVVRVLIVLTPVAAAGWMVHDAGAFVREFLRNEEVPLALLLFGTAGQLIFAMRFVYQWFYSYRIGRSVLPTGFWVISLCGSGIITIYGFIRLDPVLILGQSFGLIVYIRNLYIGKHANKSKQPEK